MSTLRALLTLLVMLTLQGCLEGGIGGTGTGFTGDPGDSDSSGTGISTVTGFATKGPFVEGSAIAVHRIGQTAGTTNQTTGGLGQFTAEIPDRAGVVDETSPADGECCLIEVTGRYFSEQFGALTDDSFTLSAVVDGERGLRANINLATHITRGLVLNLMHSGMGSALAIQTAETDLFVALSAVMPAPANPARFSDLVVLEGIQPTSNTEGNGWLLAFTSMVERAAVTASEVSGAPVAEELADLCTLLADDLVNDGMIGAALLQRLTDARGRLDPDRIHRNLLEFDSSHRFAAIAAESGVSDADATQYQCGVFGPQMVCAKTDSFPNGSRQHVMNQLGGMGGMQQVSIDLERVVANMNRFIDSDGDGIVNIDDDDDDNDGVADSEDDTPYGI